MPELFRAFSWMALATGSATILMFVRSVIIARLLTPEDFGVFGLASIVTSTVAVLTDLNLASSLIARSDDAGQIRRLLDTMWTAEAARQVLNSLLLATLAWPAGRYFGNPRVFPILLFVSVSPAILGLGNIGLVLYRKGIQFRKPALHRLTSELLSTLVIITVAWYSRNVWALAISQVASAAISTALSYAFHQYRPRFAFDRRLLAGSFAFSRGMLVVGVLTLVTTQFDNLVVGRNAPAAVLGAYLLAYRLANLPVDIVTDVAGTVLFPAFASSRSSGMLVRSMFLSISLLAGVMLAMRLLAADLIHIVYGRKWDATIPLLAALTLQGLFRGIAKSVSPFLLGSNRAGLDAKAKIAEAVVFVPLVVLLVAHLGAIGAAYAGIASYFVAAALRIIFAARLVPEKLWPMLASIGLAVILAEATAQFALHAGTSTWMAAAGLVAVLSVSAMRLQPRALGLIQ